jgi:hypothetical protein
MVVCAAKFSLGERLEERIESEGEGEWAGNREKIKFLAKKY